MKKQCQSSTTIIFSQQNPPIQDDQQEQQLQIYCVRIQGKKAPNYTRTHTSQPSEQNPNRSGYVDQQSRNQIEKQEKDLNEEFVEDEREKEGNNLSVVKQVVTNLITVKSVPRIKKRHKIRMKSDSDGSEINNNKKTQQNEKQAKQVDKQKQEDKSETSSNKQTKPTKTMEQGQQQNQDFSYQIKNAYTSSKYKSYDDENFEKQKFNHIIPCNAERQLGNQYGQNQIIQKQEQVESQSDEQYTQAKYLQEMKIYNHKKNIQYQRSSPKPPSLQIKFGQSMQEKFITTPIRPGFQFQSIITIQSGIFGVGNKYHLNQKYQSNILISAKKQIMSLSSSFILSLDINNHSRRHGAFLGIMQSNFSGTNWNLFCPRLSSRFNEGEVAHDLMSTLSATYISSVLGSKSTRDMNVYFIDPILSKKQSEKIKLQDQIKSQKKKYLVHLESAKPAYIKGKYQLDFKGIAKMASNKNFMLQNKNEKNMYCLAFAKQSQDTYQMNIRYPLSVMQGFALCLASLDSKILVN